MAILKNLTSPAAAHKVVIAALNDLIPALGNRSALGGGSIDLSQPLPVYFLKLSDVDQNLKFDNLDLVAWRYLIRGVGSKNSGFADVRSDGSGGLDFGGLATNKNSSSLWDAAQEAEQFAKGMSTDCKIGIIDAPAFKISALYLSGDKEAFFIPYIDGLAPGGVANKVISKEDFIKRLMAEAPAIRAANVGVPAAGSTVP